MYMYTATPDFQISLRFSLWTPAFELQTSAPNDPKMTWSTKRSKVSV